MSMPRFTAEAALYKTSRRYSTFPSGFVGSPGASGVVPAYFPGAETQARCSDCLGDCASTLSACAAIASTALAGCLFPPACPVAVAAAGAALAACNTASLACEFICETTKCCPKFCGGFPNPFLPGSGCCDTGEHCVDSSDPNSRDGCCPADRSVCGGTCCDAGDNCCGESCCPAGWFCSADGVCTEYLPFGGPGPARGNPRFSAQNPRFCPVGQTACGDHCCPPDMECCWSMWSKSMECSHNCIN